MAATASYNAVPSILLENQWSNNRLSDDQISQWGSPPSCSWSYMISLLMGYMLSFYNVLTRRDTRYLHCCSKREHKSGHSRIHSIILLTTFNRQRQSGRAVKFIDYSLKIGKKMLPFLVVNKFLLFRWVFPNDLFIANCWQKHGYPCLWYTFILKYIIPWRE